MFYFFFILDIIYIIISIFVYKYQLNNTQSDIENQIKINSIEVSNSLSQLIIHIINKIQLDLILIYKHFQIYKNINISNNNCFLNENMYDEIKDYLNLISKNNSYPIATIEKNISNSKNILMDEYLSKLKIQNQFNYISYLKGKDEYDNENICFMIPILKSIIFREISIKKNNTLLNNIFFISEKIIYQYPPNNKTLLLLQNIENYSKTKSNCRIYYSGTCFTNELNSKLNNQNNSNIIHILNKDMKIFSCISIEKKIEDNIQEYQIEFLCLENILENKLNLVKDFYRKKNSLILAKQENSQIQIYFSSNLNKTDFMEIYSNKHLGNYSYSNNNILLFHIFYYEIFKYKKAYITKDLIENLIDEYKNISNKINGKISEIINNNTKSINLSLTTTFIDVNYNISGVLDYENGEIKKNIKVFLEITPILIQSINSSNQISDKKDLFCFEINLFRFSTKVFDGRTFDIFLMKCFRSFYIFSFILYFLTSLNSTLFTKFLDSIFYPIILLTKHLKKKILLKDIFQNKNLKKKKKNKELINIKSHNPEMQNLIQLCKFLENIIDMKKLIQTKEQIEIDFSLMNEIYSELTTNKEIINYGHFVSNFYFQKGKYEECSNSIKIIEDILKNEKKRIKNENENIEIEILNILTNISYVNEFRKSNEIFQINNIISQKYYYDLLIISEKLYFMNAICLYFKAKKLKKELKIIIENNTKTNKHKKIIFKKKIRNTFKKNNLINNKEGDLIEVKKEIILNFIKAGKYFKKSLDINKKFGINKIKSIIILIYLSKCYMQKNLFKKSDSIEAIKNAIISLFNLNQYFSEMYNKIHLNPRIMLLINGIIFEQIIYNIAKINQNNNNDKLAAQMFLNSLSISYFKTDNIQSKSCKHLINLIKYSVSKNNKNLLQYLQKIQFRLNSKIIKYQNDYENVSKNIFLLFSNKLIEIIPTKIELCEIISNCVKNYLHQNDNVWCNRFDFSKEFPSKKAKDISKDFLMRILSQNPSLNYEKYGMQNIIFKINEIINTIIEEKKNNNNMNLFNLDKINKNNLDDKNIIFDDNYIFQFILLSDYIFDSANSKTKFKQYLNNNNISLYTFVFDEDFKDKKNDFKESKFNKIIHNLKNIPEGVLIYVNNFNLIKLAFQNISRIYIKKNVFNINLELNKNIFLDYHNDN